MDVSAFQQFIGPAALRFLASNADLVRFLVIAGVLIGGWLVADVDDRDYAYDRNDLRDVAR